MKKLIVSIGLAAAGTAGLHAAYAPDAGPDLSKDWTISGTLRGFYDDNYLTTHIAQGSWGFEVSPSVSLNVPLQQTEIGVRYTYGLYYYQRREELDQNPIDQTHQLDLWIDHAFNERWQARVSDTFAVGQDPQLLNPVPTGGNPSPNANPFRVNGNNVANTAVLSLNTDWTRLFSTVLRYQNSVYDYENSGATEDNFFTHGNTLAGLLDRVDQQVSLNFEWHVAPETTAFVGYQFEQINYFGDEPISYSTVLALRTGGDGFYQSEDRDNRSHFVYAGVQHNLLANLNVSARAGAQFTDYYNDPLTSSSVSPYVVLSATYTYTPGSYAEIGFNQERNATDVASVNSNSGSITEDQESSEVYGSLNQRITPKLMGSLLGNIQYSTFNGGANDNNADVDYSAGVNLSYAFTRHFSADLGYNYDHLTSDIQYRGYSRNRVYISATATY
ncbi:MAG TPA: outer membrane beta-barrel protein [Verrucomicrobiae bacterium]